LGKKSKRLFPVLSQTIIPFSQAGDPFPDEPEKFDVCINYHRKDWKTQRIYF